MLRFISHKYFVVAVAAFLVRIGWMLVVYNINPEHGFYQEDSSHYWSLGHNLKEFGFFGFRSEDEIYPIHNRVPGYPVFVMLLQYLPTSTIMLVLVQIGLSTVKLWLTAKIGELLNFSKKQNLLALWLVALDLPSILHANLVMSETLFTSVLLLAIYFLARGVRNSNTWSILSCGILMGLIMFIRPITIYLPIVLISSGWLFRILSVKSGVLLLVSYLVVLPWMGRNKSQFGSWFFSTMQEQNVFNYRGMGAEADARNIELWKLQKRIRAESIKNAPIDPVNQSYEFARYQNQLGWEMIYSNPLSFVKITVNGMLRCCFAPARSALTAQFVKTNESSCVFAPYLSGLLLLQFCWLSFVWIGVFGWIVKPKCSKNVYLLLILIVYFIVISSGPEADARFRVPVVSFLALLAADGWSHWRHAISQFRAGYETKV